MSACIIARHRAIGRPGVGGVAGRQGGGLSEGQAGSGRQAAQRTPPPREGAYLFLAIPEDRRLLDYKLRHRRTPL